MATSLVSCSLIVPKISVSPPEVLTSDVFFGYAYVSFSSDLSLAPTGKPPEVASFFVDNLKSTSELIVSYFTCS